MRILGTLLVFSLLLPTIASASGTFIAWPPKPKPKVDCADPANKDKPECK
jgi:hypothetical protein